MHLFVVFSCSTLTSCLISRESMQSTKTTESTRCVGHSSFPVYVYWSVVYFMFVFTSLLFISCLCLLVCCSFPVCVYWSVVHFLFMFTMSGLVVCDNVQRQFESLHDRHCEVLSAPSPPRLCRTSCTPCSMTPARWLQGCHW